MNQKNGVSFMPFVDIPLDDYDTYELVGELKHRDKNGRGPDLCSTALEILADAGITTAVLAPIRATLRRPLADQAALEKWREAASTNV